MPDRPAAVRRVDRWTLAAAVAVIAGIDAVTKLLATATLDDGPVHIAGPLNLQLGHNAGVAFGIGADGPAWILVAATAIVIAALAIAAWRGAFHPLAAGLVLGGAIANLADRASNGSVVDMIDIGAWPTFNVADIGITIGAAALALTLRHATPTHTTTETPAAATTGSD